MILHKSGLLKMHKYDSTYSIQQSLHSMNFERCNKIERCMCYYCLSPIIFKVGIQSLLISKFLSMVFPTNTFK